MSLTTPTVTSASFNAVAMLSVLPPLTDTVPISVPFNFASVANLQVVSGTYTPNDDSVELNYGQVDFTSANSPNFLIFICDGQANLGCLNAVGDYFFDAIPVNKMFFTTMIPLTGGTNYLTRLFLDGSIAQEYPMAQGIPLNYTLVYGQAVIT